MAESAGGGNGSRREAATWAIGSTVAGLGLTWVGFVQMVQEPIVRDVAALDRRVDEAVRGANLRLDELAARTQVWRTDYAADVQRDIEEAGDKAEERRKRMAQRQDEINAHYGQAIGEVAGRFNRFMEERGQLLGEALALRKQLQDHVVSIDQRLREVEEALERLPQLNCTAAGNCAQPFGPR